MTKEELHNIFEGPFTKTFSLQGSFVECLSIRKMSAGRQLYIVLEDTCTYILYRNEYPDDQHDFITRKIGKLPPLNDFTEDNLQALKALVSYIDLTFSGVDNIVNIQAKASWAKIAGLEEQFFTGGHNEYLEERSFIFTRSSKCHGVFYTKDGKYLVSLDVSWPYLVDDPEIFYFDFNTMSNYQVGFNLEKE